MQNIFFIKAKPNASLSEYDIIKHSGNHNQNLVLCCSQYHEGNMDRNLGKVDQLTKMVAEYKIGAYVSNAKAAISVNKLFCFTHLKWPRA